MIDKKREALPNRIRDRMGVRGWGKNDKVINGIEPAKWLARPGRAGDRTPAGVYG